MDVWQNHCSAERARFRRSISMQMTYVHRKKHTRRFSRTADNTSHKTNFTLTRGYSIESSQLMITFHPCVFRSDVGRAKTDGTFELVLSHDSFASSPQKSYESPELPSTFFHLHRWPSRLFVARLLNHESKYRSVACIQIFLFRHPSPQHQSPTRLRVISERE
jgi:hypothetical protein